jgi:nitronate monooxygenase
MMQKSMRALRAKYPWAQSPLVVQAPMKVLAGPALAVATSEAGGLGFLGPGDKPEQLEKELSEARELVQEINQLKDYLAPGSSPILPIGFGIQTWCGDLVITKSILQKIADTHPPCAAWLFAPRNGQKELDEWAAAIRAASPRTEIWIQLASITDCAAAAQSPEAPDVLVVQGSDAGGHSLTKGAGLITLLPEISDKLAELGSTIPIVAAGGIADARGAAACFALGASAVVLGTRFLVTSEARINPGYQKAIIDGSDGGQTTVKTQLYNHLRGLTTWPPEFDARGLSNASWREHEAGVDFGKIKELHAEAVKKGQGAWGQNEGRTATYAGTNVGLIKKILPATEIVMSIRGEISSILGHASEATRIERLV